MIHDVEFWQNQTNILFIKRLANNSNLLKLTTVYIPLEKIREDALLLAPDANNIIDRILDEQKPDERQEMVVKSV